MARIPIIESRVDPGVLRAPTVRIPEPPGFADQIAQAADQYQARAERTAAAERETRKSEARFGLDTDLRTFVHDARNDPDPDTIAERYRKFAQDRRDHYANGLAAADREEFVQRADMVSQLHEFGVKDVEIAARNDSVLASFSNRMNDVISIYPTQDSADANALVVGLLDRLQVMADQGIISHVKAEQFRQDINEQTLNGLASRHLAEDPAALLDIEENPRFEFMADNTKLSWRIKAETEIERRTKQAEAERRTQEREYLTSFDTVTRAMQSGATLSPVLEAQISDNAIDLNVSDPEMRAVMKAQRDIVAMARSDATTLSVQTPEEMRAYRDSLEAQADAPVSSVAGASIATMQQARLDNVDKAIAAITEARETDSAAFAIQTNEGVGAAWDAFATDMTPETFGRYKAALTDAYATQGYSEASQRLFPKNYAESLSAGLNSQWAATPEEAAIQISAMASAMGKDWSRGFAEMQAAGLAPEVAAIGYVPGHPVAQQVLVAIGQNGGFSALRSDITPDQRREVDELLQEEMAAAFHIAGGSNGGFMEGMNEAARTLAYAGVRSRTKPDDAVRNAVAQVLHANFTVVDQGNIKGMVSSDMTFNDEALDIGSGLWLKGRTEDDHPVTFTPMQIPGGEWINVPSRFGGSDVKPETALSLIQQFGFRDPVTNQPMQRFNSQEAALASEKPAPLASALDAIEVNYETLEALVPRGTRREDTLRLGRRIIANSGYFIMEPDGRSATLVTDAFGLPIEIIGAEGQPISVPIEELESVGLAEIRRRDAEKRMRSTREPSGPEMPQGTVLP